jgi:hypothetical protein
MTALITMAAVAAEPKQITDTKVPAVVAQGRDLNAYDNGGTFRTPVNERAVVGVDKLRRFLWSHWIRKRRCFAAVIEQGTDAGAENYLFIESEGGRWHVVWRILYYSIIEGMPKRPPDQLPEIVRVERRHNALIFRDAKDTVVKTL